MAKAEQEIVCGDSLEVLARLRACSVDAVVTDPPYGLSKEPDIAEVLRYWLAGDRYEHGHKGFMNHEWDSLVPGPEYWRECYRVLKPGGHLLAFSSTRTDDLLSIAIRFAGFVKRDTIRCEGSGSLAMVHGQGFPKSKDVSKAIDEEAGVEREVVGERTFKGKAAQDWSEKEGNTYGGGGATAGLVKVVEVTAPATDDAKKWQGWGTALKPAWEPILVFRKPLEGTVAHNVLTYGTGGLNIDACRIMGADATTNHARSADGAVSKGIYGDSTAQETHQTQGQALGRWPSNLVLVHSDDCEQVGCQTVVSNASKNKGTGLGFHGAEGERGSWGVVGEGETVAVWKCAPGCPVAVLDEQSGIKRAGGHPRRRGADGARSTFNAYEGGENANVGVQNSVGGASRFFFQAKPSRLEREAGCEHLLARTSAEAVDREEGSAGMQSPRAGAGRTATTVRNHHPTVKSIALMRWLVRLVAPKGAVVLDPFGGSGTTACAAALEGVSCLTIERESEYVNIAQARLIFWQRVAAAGLDERTFKKLLTPSATEGRNEGVG